ncbi:MAG: RNA methyltransferase [Chitinophagaceae bacterium]|nr:RNA methyltransferase [Chitinophagaceae bacterium]
MKAAKSRHENGQFVVEGPKLVLELLQDKRWHTAKVYALEAFVRQYADAFPQVPFVIVTADELERTSLMQAPQQCLALVQQPLHWQPLPAPTGWSLLLDGIQDPGNMGTILRIADWFGLPEVWATDDTVDCLNPKVVQASMGSVLRVAVHYGPAARWLQGATRPVLLASMDGQSVWQFPPTAAGILIIGHEGQGVRPPTAALATHRIAIPRLGAAESLNAGVATGILLSHLLQRR